MASYVSSYANRFYTAVESGFGQVAAITAANRISAVKLGIKQQLEVAERKDKTGSRTFAGYPPGGRRRTQWDLRTYMTSWINTTQAPPAGPLFQGCLGGSTRLFAGATAGAGGTPIGPTCCYSPATELKSVSSFDYWSPATAVQRLISGAAVNRAELRVNGDFHEFQFSGEAQDLIDTSSFAAGMGQLTAFPPEPALDAFDYSIVPGHMGQAWLGTSPERFFTITNALFAVDNGLELRAKEFGSNVPKGISPGRRTVTVDFDLYEIDDGATKALYQAARQQSPISVMFQLGEQPGQLLGVYLKSVLAEVPKFDDSDSRLQWRFRGARAQGTVDDEIVVAFG